MIDLNTIEKYDVDDVLDYIKKYYRENFFDWLSLNTQIMPNSGWDSGSHLEWDD